MRLTRADHEVTGIGGVVFAAIAMLLSLAALFTAAHAVSRANDANGRLSKLEAQGVLPRTSKVTLEEFSIAAHPSVVKAGQVTLSVSNVGTMTHELVIVRAASSAALPLVTKAGGERSVGAVDEEAIPEADKMGETGDVPAKSTVTKTFALPPGTYVMFCNIDTKQGSSVINHFARGMVATLVAG